MTPTSTRQALLIALVGLGLPCGDRAWAEDDSATSSALPDATAARNALAAHTTQTANAPTGTERAGWALGLESEHAALSAQSESAARRAAQAAMRDTLGLPDTSHAQDVAAQVVHAADALARSSAPAARALAEAYDEARSEDAASAQAEPDLLELPPSEQQILALTVDVHRKREPLPELTRWLPDLGPRPQAPADEGEDRSWPVLVNHHRGETSRRDQPELQPGHEYLLSRQDDGYLQPTPAELAGLGALATEAPPPATTVVTEPSSNEWVMESLAAVLSADWPQHDAAPSIGRTTAPDRPAVRALDDAASDVASAAAPARWAAQPDIVVVSHADRVLKSLEALLSEDAAGATHCGAQPNEILVSTQSERVLQNLAAVVGPVPHPAPCDIEIAPVEASAAVAVETAQSVKPPEQPPPTVAVEAKTAVPPAPPLRSMGEGWLALDERKLDDVRGGFIVDNGLKISFGIERAVYVNGTLSATTTLNVSELGRVTVSRSGAGATEAANVLLLQNGPNNSFSSSASNSAFGTIIQNTLNDQNIRSITTINATVNSLQVIRGMNLQSVLRTAITDSLRK